uniref:Uncharacterized protein n=1 Tax=Glycine max TaxID=3847 RepID=K7LK81_SOYBN
MWKNDGDHNLAVDPKAIKCLERVGKLHKEPSPIIEFVSIWNDMVLPPSRQSNQIELSEIIQKIDKSANIVE